LKTSKKTDVKQVPQPAPSIAFLVVSQNDAFAFSSIVNNTKASFSDSGKKPT
jgi:hypothetical protein